MLARSEFRRMLVERRAFPANSPDYTYRTRAAKMLLNIIRGIPAAEWEVK